MDMPATPSRVTTLDEFFAIPEDTSYRHELLDGVYVTYPIPSLRHARFVLALFGALHPAVEPHRELEIFPVPGDIVLGPRTVVEPDLFVVPRPPSANVHWRDIGRPVLVVEVLCRETAHRDRGVKRRLYQQAGVPEYWIVDLDARLVERWRPADERPEILTESLTWQPPNSATTLTVDLAELFAAVLD